MPRPVTFTSPDLASSHFVTADTFRPVEDQPTRVLDRTTHVRSSPARSGGGVPYGTNGSSGREPEFVYRRRRLAAAIVGGVIFLVLLFVVIGVAGGGDDPAPESTPSDLGVGGGPTINTPSTKDTTSKSKKTDTTGDSSGGTVAPATPPATGGTGGGTTVAPTTPPATGGTGGGANQAPAPTQQPAQPTGEGGGAAAPSSP
jgi:hypothetical protein